MFRIILIVLGLLFSTSGYLRERFPLLGQSMNHHTRGSFTIFERNLEIIPSTESNGDIVNRITGFAYNTVTDMANRMVTPTTKADSQKKLPVATAMQRIERDMKMLDDVAGQTPQLNNLEVGLLGFSVIVSAASPTLFSLKVIEVLVPSMAALSAAVGISAEYVGRVAVSNAKEIAALAIQAAAESEGVLAQAERSKAILPLCVGISTTASAFSLLAPTLISELAGLYSVEIVTEILLIFPLLAVLGAAIAGLASQEAISLAFQASNVGVRRFASSDVVGITWKSQAEQVEAAADRSSSKWKSFAFGVTPAPLIAALWPGNLSISCIICAAVAAMQAAYYLSIAEYAVGSATVNVALKAKAAAVSDTYANQGSKAGAVLPFTSALAGLCAAASAAVIEVLPLIHVVQLQSIISVMFPTGAAMFAAAASVSKARCEVDAAAASTAASRGLVRRDVNDKDQDPNQMVFELLRTTFKTSFNVIRGRIRSFKNVWRSGTFMSKLRRKFSQWLSKRLFRVDWSSAENRKPTRTFI